MSNELGRTYVEWCRFRLVKHYWPRIQQSVAELSEEDIWWRAHETNNSAGNLLLHLTGNLQQFVLATFGGAPDTRNKDQEFAARTLGSKEALVRDLGNALAEADRVLGQFDPSRLLERTVLQNRERSYLEVLAIVIEHFALHTGQVIYIMKLRTGKELKL